METNSKATQPSEDVAETKGEDLDAAKSESSSSALPIFDEFNKPKEETAEQESTVKHISKEIFGLATRHGSEIAKILKDSSLTPYQKQLKIRQSLLLIWGDAKAVSQQICTGMNMPRMRGTVRNLAADFYYNRLFQWQSSLYFFGAVCALSLILLIFLGASWYFKRDKKTFVASAAKSAGKDEGSVVSPSPRKSAVSKSKAAN